MPSTQKGHSLTMALLVGSICAFAATALFDPDSGWRWGAILTGLALVIVGAVRIGREYARRRPRRPPAER